MPRLGKVNTNVGLKKIVEGAYLVYLGSTNAVLLDGGPERALVLNPFEDIDRPEVAYTVPEILEPAKFKQILATAEEEVPELIPFLTTAGFAGLRRSELVREYAEDQVLRWEDINWQRQLITIRHEVAKQTSREMGNRHFIPMEAALLHWLGPYRTEEGLLIPMVDSAVRRRMKKLRLASKVNPPTNALRHSYVSYWLARSSKEGLGELSKRMGNSEAVCKRHYLETLTREEGAAWFKIRRSKASAGPVLMDFCKSRLASFSELLFGGMVESSSNIVSKAISEAEALVVRFGKRRCCAELHRLRAVFSRLAPLPF